MAAITSPSPAPSLYLRNACPSAAMPSLSTTWKSLCSRKGSKSSRASQTPSVSPSVRDPLANTRSNQMRLQTPFATTSPTRRPPPVDHAPPPAYSPAPDTTLAPGPAQSHADSPYAFLTQFDTIFLIDDSGSMAGRSWRETAKALSAITPICTSHDADGIDILFLNHRNPLATKGAGGYTNITTTAAVERLFNAVHPVGGTPTGARLQHILKPYFSQLEDALERTAHGHDITVKPLNVIVITDGVPTDDVESVIVQAAKRLDGLQAEPWQVGIQFFQVGHEPEAAEDLRELDDTLSGQHGVRDMVDTVPWSSDGQTLSAEGILKVVLGSVHRKLDRRRGSDERLRG